MSQTIFARAKPSRIRVYETYRYHAIIAGNSVTDEKGVPEGEIQIDIPYDGYQYLTKEAYRDIKKNFDEGNGNLEANIGFLAASKIKPDVFWGEMENYPPRQVLKLTLPLPNEREKLENFLEDQKKAILKHQYFPEWPDVFPRPRPISIDVKLKDEQTIGIEAGNTIEQFISENKWDSIARELSFDMSLYFGFFIDLALPEKLEISKPPILRLMKLEWPVATSYQMLSLEIVVDDEDEEKEIESSSTENQNGDDNDSANNEDIENEEGSREHSSANEDEGDTTDSTNNEVEIEDNEQFASYEAVLLYNPEQENIEWRDVEFVEGSHSPYSETTQHLKLFCTPLMILSVFEPGELYQKDRLICKAEIELEDILLSGFDLDYFDATGEPINSVQIEKKTRILADIEIVLEERFNNKIISPIRQLQFEGVILDEMRMGDIAILLRDLGFDVSDAYNLSESISHPEFALMAWKSEGPDIMLIWIHAKGTLGVTERETKIPGGKTFTTKVESGNMTLDLRSELRGNIQKLTSVMDTIHIQLKDRFRHVSTLE